MFVAYMMTALVKQMEVLASGGTFKEISKTNFATLQIPLPPLETQQEIVAELESYQKITDGARQVIENYRPEIKIDPNWEEVRLGDKILLISGQHIESENYSETNIGTPYITGPADYGKYHPIITKWTDVPKVLANKNDILITVKGSGIGSLNILDLDAVCISRQIMAIRRVGIDMLYLFFFLQSKYEYFQEKGTGAAIPGLTRSDLLDLIIPLPPLEIQQQISEKIESERALVNSTEKLIEIFEQKIKDKVAEVWGEETPPSQESTPNDKVTAIS